MNGGHQLIKVCLTLAVFTAYAAELYSQETSRVSISSLGIQGNTSSQDAEVSGTGRYITFYSWASNLVPGDANGQGDIFLHDAQSATDLPPFISPHLG